jgi:hypothetical protein
MADNETPLGWLTYPNAGDRSWFSSDAQGQGIADWLARVELLGVPTYATYADLPDPTTTPTASNTGGFTQRQFAAVVGDATVYRSDGSNWIPWLGSGTLNRRLPDTRYFDSADANDMSVQNAPTSASDVARQAELDGKADDPHDNAAHSESYTTTAENVENFGTGGATNAVPVSQGDGTLQMQTTVENSDKLDGLDASDFNTDSDTGSTDELVSDFPSNPDTSDVFDNEMFIGFAVSQISLTNIDDSDTLGYEISYGNGDFDSGTLSPGDTTTVNANGRRITTLRKYRAVRIFSIDYYITNAHNHSMS